MAHPGLWGAAGLAVALVAAGVWLNREPAAAISATSAEPTAAPLEARPEPDAPLDVRAEAQPDPQPERPAETDARPQPSPSLLIQRDEGQGGLLLTPPPGQPAPRAVTESPGKPAVPDAAESPGTFAGIGGFDPFVPAGPPVWQTRPGAMDANAVAALVAQFEGRFPAAGWYAAIAASADTPETLFAVQGFASLAAAENAATTLCSRAATGCRAVAQLVPQDAGDRRHGTLGAGQVPVWTAFLAQTLTAEAPHAAFAHAVDGSAGQAVGASESLATQRALQLCTAMQGTRDRPQGSPFLRCQIGAMRRL